MTTNSSASAYHHDQGPANIIMHTSIVSSGAAVCVMAQGVAVTAAVWAAELLMTWSPLP